MLHCCAVLAASSGAFFLFSFLFLTPLFSTSALLHEFFLWPTVKRPSGQPALVPFWLFLGFHSCSSSLFIYYIFMDMMGPTDDTTWTIASFNLNKGAFLHGDSVKWHATIGSLVCLRAAVYSMWKGQQNKDRCWQKLTSLLRQWQHKFPLIILGVLYSGLCLLGGRLSLLLRKHPQFFRKY